MFAKVGLKHRIAWSIKYHSKTKIQYAEYILKPCDYSYDMGARLLKEFSRVGHMLNNMHIHMCPTRVWTCSCMPSKNKPKVRNELLRIQLVGIEHHKLFRKY